MSRLVSIKSLSVLAFVVAPSIPASAQSPSRARAVDAIVRSIRQSGMPGCAAGVVERGSLVMTRAYGLADVENDVRITDQTRFDIGSMSKQFLAMVILMLNSQQKLSLDADVHDYLPDLPRYPWKVTLRQMLHHTSGIKDYDQLLQLAGWRDGDLKSINDVLWIVGRQSGLAFEPGTRFMYSDSNYLLLGLIAQRVTGKPVDQLLREMVFQPLGMKHTQLRTDRWQLVPHKAWPYAIESGKPRLFINAEEPLGDGGIFSTIGDLALWERNFDDHKVGGVDLLTQMQNVQPLSNGVANDYAAGLYIRKYAGLEMIEHSGTSYGYQADKLRFPWRRLSIIVLCNRRDGSYIELSNRLADLFLGIGDSTIDMPSGTMPPGGSLDRFPGVYFSDEAADGVLLEVRNGTLYDGGEDRPLHQTGLVTFAASAAGTLCRCERKYAFEISSDGNVVGFTLTTPTGSRVGDPPVVSYKRIRSPKPQSDSEYLGQYVSKDVASVWCLFDKEGSVVIRRKGFRDRPVPLLWADAAEGPGGIMQFDRNSGREVTGFFLRNIRVNSVRFDRLQPNERPSPTLFYCPGF
jgi:CubicO group peptidase (beta-lactamase class C family)